MNEETLKELLEETKKQLRLTKFIAIGMGAMLLLLLIAVLAIVPGMVRMLRTATQAAEQAQGIMTQAQEAIAEVDASLDGIDTMTQSLTRLSDETFRGISEVDFEALGEAIDDLKSAVEPFARFSRALGGGN